MVKVNKRNFLEERECVIWYVQCNRSEEKSYVSHQVLLFAQNFVIYIQLGTQVGNVFFDRVIVWSQPLTPCENKQRCKVRRPRLQNEGIYRL